MAMTVIWIAIHLGTAADNNAARGRERIVYIYPEFSRHLWIFYVVALVCISFALNRSRQKKRENKKYALVCLVEVLNCEIYGIRKSQRGQVYKINPDARPRFTALRRLSVLRARENLINVADAIKVSFDYHR